MKNFLAERFAGCARRDFALAAKGEDEVEGLVPAAGGPQPLTPPQRTIAADLLPCAVPPPCAACIINVIGIIVIIFNENIVDFTIVIIVILLLLPLFLYFFIVVLLDLVLIFIFMNIRIIIRIIISSSRLNVITITIIIIFNMIIDHHH